MRIKILILGFLILHTNSFAAINQPPKSFDEKIERFYVLAKKPQLTKQERSWMCELATSENEYGEPFISTFLSKYSVGGDQEKLQKRVFIFSKLIEFGADLEETTPEGDTVLHSLAVRQTPSKKLIPRKRYLHDEYAQAYEENKRVNYQKERSIVSPMKRIDVEGGANENVLQKIINKKNMYGATPLHVAIKTASSNVGLIQTLLDLGADPTIQDHFGRTVLHLLVLNRMLSDELKLENLEPFFKFKNLASVKDSMGNTAFSLLYEKEKKEIDAKKRNEHSAFLKKLGNMDRRVVPERLRCILD
jgi:ankyrin repeat protein